ncbi:hypothetical protein CspeluHIS016_0502020 [Cutaneotrichosporon spelunceum]|uniref:Uncharacterized protein n=1 Tax=Cutaneotrichosporon spelunceum TaxID=1672016 RepID=A0AAD3TWE4_9TREE|nr:hypothetical protein CspeluHIS016_0502020 [Cutaneotrichosporon spelunceum]
MSDSSPIATVSTSTATSAASMRSTTSAQHRVRRKPVPLVDEFGVLIPASQPSMPSPPPREKARIRAVRHKSLDPRNAPDHKSQTQFQVELDRLFDELFEEYRAGAASPTVYPSPENSEYSCSRSGHPENLSTSLLRVQTVRESRVLRDSDANVVNPPTAQVDKRTLSKDSPFFASSCAFGVFRSTGRPYPSPEDGQTTAGRVRNAVMEIERNHPTPTNSRTATPIKTLGAILDRAPLTDSTELSLESKRMMEFARRRRTIR